MRKMKKWLALMVAGMMTVGLMGCSGSSDEGKKESGSDKADMKAAVVFGLGGLGDQSYNDLAYEGICSNIVSEDTDRITSTSQGLILPLMIKTKSHFLP